MKVALCFSGMPRFVYQTHAYWQRCLLQPYAPDVFVHLWRTHEQEDERIAHFIQDVYQPRMLRQEHTRTWDVSIYKDRIWPHRTSPQTQISQYYGIQQSQHMRANWEAAHGFTYDVVIRARFDWYLQHVHLEINDCVNVAHTPTLCNHKFLWQDQTHVGISDQFAYGSSAVMTVYGDLVDNMANLYLHHGIDFCGELFLRSHLLFHNIPVREHVWNNGIVRSTHIMP
jgi:hypothetical protein